MREASRGGGIRRAVEAASGRAARRCADRAQIPPQVTPTDHLNTFLTSPVLALITTLKVCLPSAPE